MEQNKSSKHIYFGGFDTSKFDQETRNPFVTYIIEGEYPAHNLGICLYNNKFIQIKLKYKSPLTQTSNPQFLGSTSY